MENTKKAFRNFISRDGIDAAAVLSFSTLFAAVPILTIAFGVFSLSPYFNDLQIYLEEFLFQQLLPSNYDVAAEYLTKFAESARGISGFSIIFLIMSAIILFYSLDAKLNYIYESETKRHAAKGLLIYLAALFLGPLLLAASLFWTSYISKQELFIFVPMGAILILMLPIILSAIGLALMYYFIPTPKIKIKNSLKAGFLSALLLEVIKSFILIYINYFPVYKIIYGIFSFVFLFILWVYLSWIIILFGMSYCKILEEQSCLAES